MTPGRLPPDIAVLVRRARRLEREAATLDATMLRREAMAILDALTAWIATLPEPERAAASRRLVLALR